MCLPAIDNLAGAGPLLAESGLIRWLRGIDFFYFYSDMLAIIVTVYFTIITLQTLWGWYTWLAGKDKYSSLLRRYLLVQGLRLRFRRFAGDILVCALLCIAFLLIWRSQLILRQIYGTLEKARTTHVARTTR